jgi:hypothetical protein
MPKCTHPNPQRSLYTQSRWWYLCGACGMTWGDAAFKMLVQEGLLHEPKDYAQDDEHDTARGVRWKPGFEGGI